VPELALPITTERLLLRREVPGDAPAIQAYRTLAEVNRYLAHGSVDVAFIRDRIERVWSGPFEQDGDVLGLAVEERYTGRFVGDAVLFLRSVEHRGGEVGYALDPAHTGKGYATEAAGAVLRLGFETFGMHRIVARLDPRNVPSARVLERLGMRPEAHFVRNEYSKGEWTDELVYAMLADEWAAPRR
jgi:RimJ/RimL family protein N-acetyltransferase